MGLRQTLELGCRNGVDVAIAPDVQALLGIPAHVAVCALMPLGRPVRMLSRLKRRPVAEFAMRERWGGAPFGG